MEDLSVASSGLIWLGADECCGARLWLFRRYGLLAMFGLRLAFYLFWHILWGSAPLALLF